MRRNVVTVGMCVAVALAVAGPMVQATAAAITRTGSAGAAGVRSAGAAASPRGNTGVITGVLLGARGRTLPGACVTATPEAGVASAASAAGTGSTGGSMTVRTSVGGRYFFGGLRAGRYSLRYHSCTHPAGPGGVTSQTNVSAGQLVRLAPVTLRQPRLAGTATDGPGPALPAGTGITRPAEHRLIPAGQRKLNPTVRYGGISGRVKDAAGRPIKGLCVTIYGKTWGEGPPPTSAQGTYRSGKNLPPGHYTVQFGVCLGGKQAGNWAPQWYHGQYSQAHANVVTVRAGKVTTGINAVMRRGGIISGVVTGKRDARVSHVCVNVVTANGKQYVTQAETVKGRYRINSLDAGRYRVYFDPACGYHATPYLGQWWPGVSKLKDSKTVRVRFGAVTGHVDAALRVGGKITGTVRFRNSRGKPLSGICVFGMGLGKVSSVGPNAVTRKNGTFVMEGLPAGRYQLQFGAVGCGNKGNYLYYNDPHPVRVGLGQTAHVSVFMKPGAIISGTVTSAATGLPLAGVCVFVNDYFGDGGVSGADGKFRIDQIQPGRYSVGFSGGCGSKGSYAPQWFRNRSEPFNAGKVVLRGGKLTSGVDAAMRPGSAIAGVVKSQAGLPLGRICIGAYTPNEAGYLFGVFGDFYNGQTRRGVYQISNLAAGQYQIVFFSCGSGPGWTSQWYRSASGLGAAGLLDVPAATTVSGINAKLTRGGAISGTVRGPAGIPDSFICIVATNLASGASESTFAGASPANLTDPYAIGGLAPGRYRVEFSDCGGTGMATQWYSGKTRQAAATPITVRAAQVTKRIDAVLAKSAAAAGSISGRVTSRATGRPLPGICVTASSASVVRGDRTDAHGHYAITHLASGRYQLYIAACRGDRYARQVRPGKVAVRSPHAVRGVNFAVSLAGSISGAVVGGSPTSRPRPGICVTVVPLSGVNQPGYAVTGRSGAYSVRGLAPGSYDIYFDPIGCYYGAMPFSPQWYSGQVTQSTAAPVAVKAGAGTAGIDATLDSDGTIAGTITGPAPAGSPLSGICVQATPVGALARAGDRPVYSVSQSGGYSLADLPPGKYLVSFTSGCGASGYAPQWWQNASSRADAKRVTVAPGSVTNGIDAAMER